MEEKIILITGPRQVGKTTLAKMLGENYSYLNYDDDSHRRICAERSWDRKVDFVIFDELHKMRNWKSWIKGVFDTEGNKPSLVVTGSARLDTATKVGDSLAGRYFQYRIYPFDLRELSSIAENHDSPKALDNLLNYSGFPEPYLKGTEEFYNLWKKTHMDIVLKQDLIYVERNVRDIRAVELLIDLLKTKVGSPLSYKSLVEDIEGVTDKTIKGWLASLEQMYLIFKILPFHKNVARSNLKRPKYYFYDSARVKDPGARVENFTALSLLKECHFRQDCLGEDWKFYYIGKKGGGEIDFLMTKKECPQILIEVKTSDDRPSKNFRLIQNDFPHIKKIQLVKKLKKEKMFPDGTEIRDLAHYLSKELAHL